MAGLSQNSIIRPPCEYSSYDMPVSLKNRISEPMVSIIGLSNATPLRRRIHVKIQKSRNVRVIRNSSLLNNCDISIFTCQ